MLNIVHLSAEILDLVAVELNLDHEQNHDDSVANRLKRNTNLTRYLEAIGKGICR